MSEIPEQDQRPGVLFQHLIVSFADGRRGVFYGPAVIKEIEMKLGTVPRLVSVDFDPPRPIQMPVPTVKEEVANADTPPNDAPANDVGA